MATVEAEISARVSQAEAWDFFFAQVAWPGWVDGFDHVVEQDGYPTEGGVLRWATGAAGRGEVLEQVVSHEPRRIHVVEVSDQFMTGRLTTTFSPLGDEGSRIHQQLEYELIKGGPFSRVTDFLFIRSQMKSSLQRSLNALGLEAEDFAAAASEAVDKLIG